MYVTTCFSCGSEISSESLTGSCANCGKLYQMEWPSAVTLSSDSQLKTITGKEKIK